MNSKAMKKQLITPAKINRDRYCQFATEPPHHNDDDDGDFAPVWTRRPAASAEAKNRRGNSSRVNWRTNIVRKCCSTLTAGEDQCCQSSLRHRYQQNHRTGLLDQSRALLLLL